MNTYSTMNIFRRWLSPKTEQNNKDCHNPWAGLASYEDPDTAKRKLKFYGRDDESYDVTKLIMGNVFVTLYGKSGIGKTSLLNAAVFPELREKKYTPLNLRLGLKDVNNPRCYQSIIIDAIEHAICRIEIIDVIEEQNDTKAVDYLWNYFTRHRFYNKFDEPTYPVIVFDQFEEILRIDRKDAEVLLRQIDYVNDKDHSLENSIVDGHAYRYEQNFRFVISIREDDLYRLEDCLDNCYLHALKRCRFRLRNLTKHGARDVIFKPVPTLFEDTDKDDIFEAIINTASNKYDGEVSTNLLSLICSQIYEKYIQDGSKCLTKEKVKAFISKDPFEKFYMEATKSLSPKERSYLEESLIDDDLRRDSISETDFKKHIKNGEILLEGERRFLQRTSMSTDHSSHRIELIHDSFCDTIAKLKHKKKIKKNVGCAVKWFLLAPIGLILFAIISIIATHPSFEGIPTYNIINDYENALTNKNKAYKEYITISNPCQDICSQLSDLIDDLICIYEISDSLYLNETIPKNTEIRFSIITDKMKHLKPDSVILLDENSARFVNKYWLCSDLNQFSSDYFMTYSMIKDIINNMKNGLSNNQQSIKLKHDSIKAELPKIYDQYLQILSLFPEEFQGRHHLFVNQWKNILHRDSIK